MTFERDVMSGRNQFLGRAFGNAYLLLSLTSLFWAGNQVIGRAVAGHVPPIALAFLRWSLAAVVMVPPLFVTPSM